MVKRHRHLINRFCKNFFVVVGNAGDDYVNNSVMFKRNISFNVCSCLYILFYSILSHNL